MTITLNLPAHLSDRLIAEAARNGQSVEDYLLTLLDRDSGGTGSAELTLPEEKPDIDLSGWNEMIRRLQAGYEADPAERKRVFAELVKGVYTGVSQTDEELRREAIYDDQC
ncbi:MAG: hypothetical protein LC772_04195 [Chloroflexi bacterium]|nr:hypothetical protein [Chloroflexota bacterium]